MKKLSLLILSSFFMLGGCASTSTQMVNDKGQVANCGAWGVGIIGTSAALISTHNCISKLEAAGYHEVGVSPDDSGTSSATQNGTPQVGGGTPSVSATFTTMTSKDGSIKITLPAGWVESKSPTSPQLLSAKNTSIDAGLVMSSVNVADIQDWQAYAESRRAKLMGALSQSTSSEVLKLKVKGFDALQADVGGNEKNGLKVHYLGTIIKTDKQIIYLLSWSLESKFEDNRGVFKALPQGLQL